MTDTSSDFRVALLYHPIAHVPDLDEAEHFYARVFGRPSTNLSTVMTSPPAPGHSTDYSTFTMIGDVLIDSLAPGKYFTAGGVQRYPDVATPHLETTGWYVDGVAQLYAKLRAAGVRLVNARDILLEDEEWAGGPSPFYSFAEDTGLRYQFFETFPFPLDPRVAGDWHVPAVSEHDPLRILHASHHTVLTSRPERAVKLTVDILGGEIIYEGRDALRSASGPYVRLADSIFHFATPEADTAAASELARAGTKDVYSAITWKVADLYQAARHLEASDVRIAEIDGTSIVTDPATSLGVPWGFTTESLPGDER